MRSLRFISAIVVLGAAASTLSARAQNLLSNPNFDAGLTGWTATGSTTFTFDGTQGSPNAGSSAATLTGSLNVGVDAPVAGQCVPLAPGARWYEGGGKCKLDSGAGTGNCHLTLDYYSDSACVTPVNSIQGGGAYGSSATWSTFLTRIDIPAGVASVKVKPTLYKASTVTSVSAHFDTLFFRRYAKGDTDGDGQPEIFFSATISLANAVWKMNGITEVTSTIFTPSPASADWRLAVMDDFNWDGQSDLVFQNMVTGEVEFWMMNGTTRVGAPVALAGHPSAQWRLVASAPARPFAGSHFVWQNSVTHKLVVWLMSGSTSTDGSIIPSPDQAADANWSLAAAADFNGDGDTDFLWYNQTTGKVVLWLLNQNFVRQSGQFTNPSSVGNNNWKVVAAGDYGIGTAGVANTNDILWRNDTSGKLVVWFMDNAGNRTAGAFTTPDSPSSPLSWTVAGPR